MNKIDKNQSSEKGKINEASNLNYEKDKGSRTVRRMYSGSSNGNKARKNEFQEIRDVLQKR